jgi:hypothetical protein
MILKDNVNVVSAVLHLREASSNLIEIQPRTSNILLDLSNELLKTFNMNEDEVSEMKDMADEIAKSGDWK